MNKRHQIAVGAGASGTVGSGGGRVQAGTLAHKGDGHEMQAVRHKRVTSSEAESAHDQWKQICLQDTAQHSCYLQSAQYGNTIINISHIHRVGTNEGVKLGRVHRPPISERLGWLQVVLDERAIITQNIKSFVGFPNTTTNLSIIRLKQVEVQVLHTV
jgi:hypothetical protein